MADVKISDIAPQTGFGVRYWQRRIGKGEVPSAKFVQIGQRRVFLVDEQVFNAWWQSQKQDIPLCQKISGNEVKRGGIVSSTQAKHIKAPWRQTTSEQLKTALKELSES